ncbi:hypothetical protein TNCV_2296211 [Trichonephila clavipes]|nr:hypothetical protein TNCV_2296211 [Trichonephila clavipes]
MAVWEKGCLNLRQLERCRRPRWRYRSPESKGEDGNLWPGYTGTRPFCDGTLDDLMLLPVLSEAIFGLKKKDSQDFRVGERNRKNKKRPQTQQHFDMTKTLTTEYKPRNNNIKITLGPSEDTPFTVMITKHGMSRLKCIAKNEPLLQKKLTNQLPEGSHGSDIAFKPAANASSSSTAFRELV